MVEDSTPPPTPAAAPAPVRRVSLVELARMLGVETTELRRLVRAGALQPVAQEGDALLFDEGDYPKVRLLLDFIATGLSPTEVRELAELTAQSSTASEAAAALRQRLDALLPALTDRIERLKRLREDLIVTREALHRCRYCHKPLEALPCQICLAMPRPLPRAIDTLFVAYSPKR